jgi:hypothetical protein
MTRGKPIALTAAAFFVWGGGGGALANAKGVSLLGLGVREILKSETSQSPGNAIKPASFS